MSWQCVRVVLDSHLPTAPKFTLVALAERASSDCSEMFAPIRDLAHDTSKRPRTVKEDLAWLEQNGIIAEVTGRRIHGSDDERVGVGGRARCPRYRLNMSALAAYRPAPKQCGPPHGLAEKQCGPPHGLAPA